MLEQQSSEQLGRPYREGDTSPAVARDYSPNVLLIVALLLLTVSLKPLTISFCCAEHVSYKALMK